MHLEANSEALLVGNVFDILFCNVAFNK